MAITGDKIGPGPASVNIRDVKPIETKQKNIPQSRRHIGEPNPSAEFGSAPGKYERKNHKHGNKITSIGVKFSQAQRNVDFIKQLPGFEELTEKGLF